MLLWLPPSEGKVAPADGPALDIGSLSFPLLVSARLEVAAQLQKISAEPGAAETLRLGPRAAASGIQANLELVSAPCAPAMDLYQGVLYAALDPNTLSPPAARALSESVWIFSALFGAVRPDDVIPDHRLAMGVRLPELGTMSSWWRLVLKSGLPDPGSQPVVDLRSGAYKSAHPAPDAHRIEVDASQVRDGKRTTVTHFAKLWRGLAARYLLEHVDEKTNVSGVLDALTVWRGGGELDDVEVGETKPTREGGSVTRVTLVLPPATSAD